MEVVNKKTARKDTEMRMVVVGTREDLDMWLCVAFPNKSEEDEKCSSLLNIGIQSPFTAPVVFKWIKYSLLSFGFISAWTC